MSSEQTVKEWELPEVGDRTRRRADLSLDLRAPGARSFVGARQPRLLRELEKLALECGPGARLDADAVLERVARSAERRAWVLADALLAGDGARPRASTYRCARRGSDWSRSLTG